MDNTIPANIQSLIEAKAAEITEAKLAKEKQQVQEQEIAEQRQLELVKQLSAQVDESIRGYPAHVHPDMNDNRHKFVIVFDVPGLAPILAVFDNCGEDTETGKTIWKLLHYRIPDADIHYDEWETDEYAAYWQRVDSYNGYKADAGDDLDFPTVLLVAKAQAQKHQQYTQEARQRNQKQAQQQARKEAAESAEAKARRQITELIERDPLALQLFHLYLTIQDERESYREALDSANCWAEEANARYERKLNDVQADLDTARRDLDYECSRADDLSYDLEEVQHNCRR